MTEVARPRVEFVIDVKTTNPLNGGMGNSKASGVIRTRKRADQREKARLATVAALVAGGVSPADVIPCMVTLIRVSAGKMDTDGLAASQKGVRDGIADALQLNDGSAFVHWRYGQAKGKAKRYFVKVTIEKRETRCVTGTSAIAGDAGRTAR